MAHTSSPSLRDLKRETEETRAGLTNTVEQLKTTVSQTADDLRQRVSPEAIKTEVSNYVRNRGERLMDDINSAARRNPMQAVAVGASLAYPLLRLARAIPLPILMVGAGLFFAGTKAGQSATQKASDLASDLSDEVRRRSHDLSDQVTTSIDTAKSAVTDMADRARGAVEAGVDQVRDATSELDGQSHKMHTQAASIGGSVNSRTQEAEEKVAGLVDGATGATKEWLSDASTSVRNAASSGANAAMDAAQDLRKRTVDASDRAGKTVFQAIEQNPLLVAGVGLLIGGLIASALPRSEIEDGLAGEASSAAKKRAQEAASKGFELAKGAAGEILENVARTAGAEGLTTDALGDAASEIGQRVKRVAEAAVTTAFDPESLAKSSAQGEHHG
jgi:CHASE3 domain sensor protein